MSSKTFTTCVADTSHLSSRVARRVIFNSDVLKSLKLSTGDVIALAKPEIPIKAFATGIVWPSLEQEPETIIVSTSLLLTAQLEPGEKAQIYSLSGTQSRVVGLPSLRQAQNARIIRMKDISDEINSSSCSKLASGSLEKQKDWLPLLLRESLVNMKYFTSTQKIEVVYEGRLRRFSIVSVSTTTPPVEKSSVDDLASHFDTLGMDSPLSVWSADWDSAVVLVENEDKDTSRKKLDIELVGTQSESATYGSVGGLAKQISEIKDLLDIPLTRPDLFRYFNLKPPKGILLHGPPGTGKTHLARAIAASTKSSVMVVNGPELSSAYHGETESKLRDVFREARNRSPCIVVLDEVDALVPRREEGGGGEVENRVVATLLTILDGMEADSDEQGRVVVIGTTNRPNAIDPALRRPGRFDREIEIGVPDIDARVSILEVLLSKTPNSVSADDLRVVASRAHGYVGADLSAVVRDSGTTAIKRWLASKHASEDKSSDLPILTLPDLLASLPSIRPSAMRSLFIDAPPVHYSDIGGQPHVIRKLREAVEWPLLHPEAFQRLGVKPPKGILLYGPPGCSKTVLARACACESGINFMAVQGPELLNKFVGESERAVREIFRKARAASPSIIFFDEIDALATSRSSLNDNASSSHEGVLTSLLNELDGVQELVGVTIVAATNRPESIDSALMRPGRLDRILYVGPPDQEGREEILKIKMKNMKVEDGIDIAYLATLTSGCSGAEISALCQEAALLTMQENIAAPFIPADAFIRAAKSTKRQITSAMLQKFESWRIQSGLQQA